MSNMSNVRLAERCRTKHFCELCMFYDLPNLHMIYLSPKISILKRLPTTHETNTTTHCAIIPSVCKLSDQVARQVNKTAASRKYKCQNN